MRDQEPFEINDFRGLWDRIEQYPKGYGYPFQDCRFKDNFVYPREPISQSINLSTLTLGANPIMWWVPFRPSTAPITPRYLILTYQSGTNTGRIYDTGAGAPATPILTITGMRMFSAQIIFDRVYISPSDGGKGLVSEFIYVYDPTLMTVARKAAGVKPTTGMTPTVGAAGNCAPGLHLVSYAFETNTGFITKYAIPDSITIPAGTPSIINLASVDVGPTGTVKRHILMTPAIINYDGNPDHYEFFFAGVINDNVTTSTTINLYDTQLVQSAAYLLDQLEELKSALFICMYAGRMCSGGEFALADSSLIRVSKIGEPESVQATDGYIIYGKGEGGRLQNAREYRSILYAFKGRRTYSATATNDPPSSWPVNTIDDNLGTFVHGIAEIVDAIGGTLDFLIIINADGVRPFDGTYPDIPLTYNIETTWRQTASRFLTQHHIVCDPVTKRFFLGIATSSTNFLTLYSCDYSQGLVYDKVRWAIWEINHFGVDPNPHGALCMHVEPFSSSGQETARLIYSDTTDNRFLKGILLNEDLPTVGDTDFDGNPANLTFIITVGDIFFSDGVSGFIAFRIRGLLASTFSVSILAEDGTGPFITGLLTSNNYLYRIFNVVAERIKTFRIEKAAQAFGSISAPNRVMELIVFGKPMWTSRPM